MRPVSDAHRAVRLLFTAPPRRFSGPEVSLPSITRALTGDNLTFDMDEQIAELRRDECYVRSGRVGRTLVKAGPLRITLTLIAEHG